MLKNLRKNDSGIILVTVLIIIVAMTVLAMATVSINTSQVKKLESFSDDFIAEKLAERKYWEIYSNSSAPANYTLTVGNRTYSITSEPQPGNPGEPVLWDIRVNY